MIKINTCQLYIYKGRLQLNKYLLRIHNMSGTEHIGYSPPSEIQNMLRFAFIWLNFMWRVNVTRFLYISEKNMILGIKQTGIQILTWLFIMSYLC